MHTEMSQEGVTYVELKLNKSKKPGNRRHPGHKKKGFPWHIISIILGILCFLLLLGTSALVYILYWRTWKCGKLTCSEGNATVSPEIEYHHSPAPGYTDKKNPSNTCHGECSYCVKNCYHISTVEKTWEESKKSCQVLGHTLLKIDDKEEQKFIQSKIKYNIWIGLKYERGKTWSWLDGSEVARQLDFKPPKSLDDSLCGSLRPSHMSSFPCTKQHRYICEEISYPDN